MFPTLDAKQLHESGNNHHGETMQSSGISGMKVARRPAVVIGVGGSGHRIVLNLKYALGGVSSDWVKLMVLDSAHEDLRLSLNDREVRMEPGNELIYIGDVSVAAIMRNLKHLTVLKETFGSSLQRLPRVTYRDGVAGNRTAGQLSFHYHIATIEKALSSRLWSLARHEGAASDDLVQSTGLNIVITGSACGGQGSGAMIDLAYLMRELLAEMGQLADNSMITGAFLLPDAFPGLQNRYLEPNTVDFLSQIEHLMSEGGYTMRFPNQREIESVESPFDRVFLIDGVDQKGRTRSSQAEVAAAAGQILHLLHATPAGQKLENDFFNFSGVLSQRTKNGELACFGSLGLAVLEADGERLQALATRQYAHEVINLGLLAEPNSATVIQATEDFENQTQLAYSALQQTLLQDPDVGQILVDATLPGHIRNKSHDELSSAVDAYFRSYRQLRLLQYVSPVVDANVEKLISSAHKGLDEAIKDAAQRFGALQAQALAVTANLRIRQQHQVWRGEWQARQAQLEEAESAFEQAMDDLSKASGQIFFLRKRAMDDALSRAERSAQALADAYLAHRIAEGAVRIMADMDRYSRTMGQRLNSVVQRLQQTDQYLQDSAAWKRRENHLLPPDIDLVDEKLVEYWYDQTNPQYQTGRIDVLTYAVAQGFPIYHWDQLTPDHLSQLLMAGLGKAFQHLSDIGIEEIVEAQKDRISPERWQSRLLEMAVPMCNLEAVRLVDGDVQPVTVTVLGVADDRDTIFDQNPEMIVATGDRKRLVALVATLGLPLSALKQWPAWKRLHHRFYGKH